MNRQIFNEAVNQFQVSKEKIQIWNITDPGEHNFTSKTESEKTAILEKTYGEIVKKVNSLAGAL